MRSVCQSSQRVHSPARPLDRLPFITITARIVQTGTADRAIIKRVASGVGEGSMAIAFIHQYLADRSAEAVRAPNRRR